MDSRNKTRLVAASAAIVLTLAMFAVAGPVAGGVAHVASHALDGLAPETRSRVILVLQALGYGVGGPLLAIGAWRASRAQRRDAAAEGRPARRD